MKHILFFVFAFLLFESTVLYGETNEKYSSVRIELKNKHDFEILLKLGLDFENAVVKDNFVRTSVSESEIKLLKQNSFNFKIEIEDLTDFYVNRFKSESDKNINFTLGEENFKLGSYGGYYPLDSINIIFQSMKNKYPKFFKKEMILNYSIEDRPIYCYIFGNGNSDQKILLTALHHAREGSGMMSLVYFLWKILEKADAGDSYANFLLQNRAIYVVPVVNPDGYFFNQKTHPEGGGMWRKNRRQTNDTTFGVDLNRNYGPFEYWDAPNLGSSPDPQRDTYRGSAPFSEPEVQAIRDICQNNWFRIVINYHTYSNLIIYPYSALSRETDDSLYYRNLAFELSHINLYYQGTDNNTVGYSTRGSSDDYIYKKYLDDASKSYPLTVEVGTVDDGFWPKQSRIIEHCRENYQLLEQVLWIADVHLRPTDVYSEFAKVSDSGYSCFLKVNLRNLGVNQSDNNSSIKVYSIDSNVVFENNTKLLNSMKQNEMQTIGFIVDIKGTGFVNGSKIPIVTEIHQNGINRRDTFNIPLYSHVTKSVFDNGTLFGNWKMGDWGTIFDDLSGEFVLNDSPKGLYRDSSSNYLTLDEPIHLDNFPVFLEFYSRWEIEPQYDFGTLEISTDNGKKWEFLKTDRMLNGYGLKDSRQIAGSSGFSGFMPLWVRQICSLEKYIGKDIIFRFGVLSDKGRNMDGWFLKNINLLVFDDTKYTGILQENEFMQINIIPNPAISGSKLHIEFITDYHAFNSISDFNIQTEIRIKNLIGCDILKFGLKLSNNQTNNISIPTSQLAYGLYFAEVKIGRRIITKSFMVLSK